MRHWWTVLLIFFLLCCEQRITRQDLEYLPGYWEIERVIFPDGGEKVYRISGTIDYFELKGMEGFRKKLQPQIDGTFKTSDDAIAYAIHEKDEIFWLEYGQGQNTWSEKISQLTNTSLVLINEENIQYHYKRYEELDIP